MIYDYLIVGTGLFGSIVANELSNRGFSCLVVDKRNHIGGNIYTYSQSDIIVHKYGAHIFHTYNKKIWDYVNKFSQFNNFINSPVVISKNNLYNLPFNMNTFYKVWNVKKPDEAKQIIENERKESGIIAPKNLEEKAIYQVGKSLYDIIIKEYTEKQWKRPAKELPMFIIDRIPIRFNYDNRYFSDPYQGVPINGYTPIIEKLLKGVKIELNLDYIQYRDYLNSISNNIIYTGRIDQYFNYVYGELEFRNLEFETKELNIENYQGNAVVNYADKDIPFTRIIEHKHFSYGNQRKTIITKEYPSDCTGNECYPINDGRNNRLFKKYMSLAKKEKNVYFGGRLGSYKYYDMDKTIEAALKLVEEILLKERTIL